MNYLFKTRKKEPKVYSLVVGVGTFRFVWLGIASTQDEAFFTSKQSLLRETALGETEIKDMELISMTHISMDYLRQELLKNKMLEPIEEMNITIPDLTQKQKDIINPKAKKNQLMKDIIKTNNIQLYNKNLRKFNKVEKQYLKSKLYENKN